MTSPVFPADFLAALDRAVEARDGRPERNEVRFCCPNPDHPDEHPSARWNRKKGVWCCDACGAGGGAFDLADKLGVEKPSRTKYPPHSQRSSRESVKPAPRSDTARSRTGESGEGDAHVEDRGLTLEALAEAKRLPVALLRDHGVRNAPKRHGQSAVVIPYLDPDGKEVVIRYRLRIDANGQRFSYRSGDKPMLYGLHRLAEIRKAGWVLLVEGESDCWTAWLHDIPVLGIPGKSTWRKEWGDSVQGIDVFLWQEPEAADLSERVMRDLPDVRIVAAPDGTKDISEAHCRGEDVAALIADLRAHAVSADDLRRLRAEEERFPLRERALPILTSDDPLAIVGTEITRLGYGGDLTPAMITYLGLTTRLLGMRRGAMPAHLLLLGPPSAGKSYTLGTVLLLLPPQAYYVIDAGSPRVLIYDDADLQHRVVVFSEADSLPAGEDNPAASALRNLLQDHHLHYKVTIRDADIGAFAVHEIDKPGPTLLVTTAVKSLGEQLMSRLFALPVPEDVKRLQQALDTQATIELDGAAEPNDALIAFQAFLQTLTPWDVVVPFARELSRAIAASANATRILRDYQRLLSLIKAVTILRHHRREQNDTGRWVATIEDYAAVYDLIGPMFEATVSGKTETIRRVVTAVTELAAIGGPPITYSAVSRKIGMHPEQVKRAVEVAIAHEWLINDQDRPNKPVRLRVGEPMPETDGLPTPEQVAAAFTGSSRPAPDLHTENPDGDASFTVSQPDRTKRPGTVLDGRVDPPSPNGANGSGAHVRVCVECGATLPPGWRGFYCAAHGGGADEQGSAASSRRSSCETVKRCDDPRFAATVANHAALGDEAFTELGEELRWLEANQPDVDDLALDLAAYAEASRLRVARTDWSGGDSSPTA